MTSIFRIGFYKVTSNGKSLLSSNINSIGQKCSISGKSLRDPTKCVKKPAPWPYKTKPYTVWNAIFDRTTHRLDDNSKIIVVEGPIAAGKSKFAKELADDLSMLYVPEATMDLHYINDYGYDMRKLDDKLPEDCRSFDVANFCKDPNHRLVANYQIMMYYLRYSQYVDAVAHLLNTGQGIVLDRCAYSDYVFLETMHKHGYVSKGARSVYHDIRNNTINELLRPHLVIYLDVPVKTVQERIKTRNIPYEVNSTVLNESYLTTMESIYKQQYLKEISTHAELLVYDWTEAGETEVVVEDIERMNFNRFDKHDPKMKDWKLPKEWDWAEQRILFTSKKSQFMHYFNVPRFDVPELLTDPYDAKEFKEIWWNAPGMKYRKGYNADMGDSGILTKTKIDIRAGH